MKDLEAAGRRRPARRGSRSFRVAACSALLGLVGVSGACSSSSSRSTGSEQCTPREAIACHAPSGCAGEKTCRADGRGYEACVCSDAASAGGTSGRGGSSGTGASGPAGADATAGTAGKSSGGAGGASGAGGSSGADSGSSDATGGGGKGGSAGTGVMPNPCAGLGPTSSCLECCRQNFLVTMADFRNAFYPCACGAGTCYGSCGAASDTCNVTTIVPSLGCFQCMSNAFGGPVCQQGLQDCKSNPACMGYAECTFRTCFGVFWNP